MILALFDSFDIFYFPGFIPTTALIMNVFDHTNAVILYVESVVSQPL